MSAERSKVYRTSKENPANLPLQPQAQEEFEESLPHQEWLVTEVGIIDIGNGGEEILYNDAYIRVLKRQIKKPNGRIRNQRTVDRRAREYVTALAITKDDKFVLVKEPKYSELRKMLTVTSGNILKGESPIIAAKRELMEHTGYEARRWVHLGADTLYESPDLMQGAAHHLYLGLNAKKAKEPPEFSEVFTLTREEVEKIIDGEIKKTRLQIMGSVAALLIAFRQIDKHINRPINNNGQSDFAPYWHNSHLNAKNKNNATPNQPQISGDTLIQAPHLDPYRT